MTIQAVTVIDQCREFLMAYKFEQLSALVVEDITPMKQLIYSILQTLGIGHIMSAENGEDGFRICRTWCPDIVFIVFPVRTVKLI